MLFGGVPGLLSHKSTIESSMAAGGQVGLADHLFDVNIEDLDWMEVDERKWKPSRLVRSPEFLGYAVRSVDGKYNKHLDFFPVYGSVLFDSELRDVLKQVRREMPWRNSNVQPAVVLEPMKGRIITKPSSGSYIDWNTMQSAFWSYLKKFRQFNLIGRPVSEEDIWYVSGSYELGKGFVSGDYSGATDNLASSVSEMILGYAFRALPHQEQIRIRESFSRAKIDYTKDPLSREKDSFSELYTHWRSTDLGIVQQSNGQLMGHVLSFPILCLANYLVFKYTFDRLGREAPRVLVNGDDILFCALPDEYKEWLKDVVSVGFFPSLGKNLYQSDVCQINSVLFRLGFHDVDDFVRVVRRVDVIPYLNMGVIMSRGKGKCVERNGSPESGLTPYLAVLGPLMRLISSDFWDSRSARECFWRQHWELRGFFRHCGVVYGDYPDSFWERSVSNPLHLENMLLASRFSYHRYLTTLPEKGVELRQILRQARRFPFSVFDLEGVYDHAGFEAEPEVELVWAC